LWALERIERLFTSNLVLEPLTVAHTEAMFPVLSDPKLYRYLDYGPPPSLDHARGVYTRLQQGASPDGRETWLNWMLCLDGAIAIGYVQATLVSPNTAWIAYFLSSNHWGNGYAYSATKAMLRHLIERYDVDDFLATVETANARSISLLERLEFERAASHDDEAHELSDTEVLFHRHAA
jgi:ribosomal-protein-alanine N-acetyltransferase